MANIGVIMPVWSDQPNVCPIRRHHFQDAAFSMYTFNMFK